MGESIGSGSMPPGGHVDWLRCLRKQGLTKPQASSHGSCVGSRVAFAAEPIVDWSGGGGIKGFIVCSIFSGYLVPIF
jgi:hypothetical protein